MSSEKEQIRSEQISLLYHNSTIGFTVSLIMGAILCLILFPHIPIHLLLFWFLSLLSITVIRFILTRRYQKSDSKTLNLRNWEMLFLVGTGLAGIIWGTSIFFLFLIDSDVHQLLILLFLAGIVGGSVGVFSPLTLAYLVFALPITLAVSIRFLIIGDIFSIIIAILTLVFFISMALATRHSEKAIRKAFALMFDNEKLRLAATVFSHAKEGIMITDPDGDIIEVNRAFQDITGFTRDEVMGKNPNIFHSGQHGHEFYASMWNGIKEKGYWSGEISNKHKNGDIFVEKLTISSVYDSKQNIQHYVGLFFDITTRINLENQLKHIAYHDDLTNLPNRVLLADRLNQAMIQAHRQEKRLAIVYLDLDNFKPVNDEYDHQTGDQLLVITANRMEDVLREGDTIARIGGDEFVVILIDVPNKDEGEILFKRLLSAVIEPVKIQNIVLNVSASVGVTFYPQKEAIDADQLLRQADQAMYQAKLSGKNRYHIFDSEQDSSIRGRNEHLEQVHQGIINQEFLLYYQPKVNMRTGMVIGVEALIRWQHPEQGLLSPAQFLPSIEEHPVAIELDNWVLKTAISQLETWLSNGLDITVSVNIDGYYLLQPNFTEHLTNLLAAHPNIRPEKLDLEILESSALKDITKVSQIMKTCQEIGVGFALDDFGTGYSSLTYLKRLPANTLKIDQTFVRNMLDEPEDISILESILGLSKAFKRQTIAEGVETVEHGELLIQLGCELAQGYAISRPMPADGLPKWVVNWQTYSDWNNQQQVKDEGLSLLYAAIEHRAWVRQIEEYIKYKHPSPPLDQNKCRFGKWLNTEGSRLYHSLAPYEAVVSLHNKVHNLGKELCQLSPHEQEDLVENKIIELKDLRDELLNNLKILLQMN